MAYGIIGAVLALLLLYVLWEPYWIQATDQVVAIPDLPPAFDGFTILQLSDIHGRVGVFSWNTFLRWQSECDAMVITGDLYSPTLSRARLARHLDRLNAPYGVYYISGNHDYRRGTLAVQPWEPGPRLLDNRVAVLEKEGQTLVMAGLPDFIKGAPEWESVRSALQVQPGPAVLLAHRPDAWLLPGVERVSLILAGHTHGGQVRLPLLGALVRHNSIPGKYVSGRLERDGKPVLITSRGLGTSELPIRLLARPEVVRVRLVRETGQDKHGEA